MLDQERSAGGVDGKTSFSMLCWTRYLYTLPWLDKADQIGILVNGRHREGAGEWGSILL